MLILQTTSNHGSVLKRSVELPFLCNICGVFLPIQGIKGQLADC